MILSSIGSAARDYAKETVGGVKENYFSKVGLAKAALSFTGMSSGVVGAVSRRALDNLSTFETAKKEVGELTKEKQSNFQGLSEDKLVKAYLRLKDMDQADKEKDKDYEKYKTEFDKIFAVPAKEKADKAIEEKVDSAQDKVVELLQKVADNISMIGQSVPMPQFIPVPMNREQRRGKNNQPSVLVSSLMQSAGVLSPVVEPKSKAKEDIAEAQQSQKEQHAEVIGKFDELIEVVGKEESKPGVGSSMIEGIKGFVAGNLGRIGALGAGGLAAAAVGSKVIGSGIKNLLPDFGKPNTIINNEAPDSKTTPKPSKVGGLGGFAKSAGKSALKKIPLLGAIAGLGFGAQRLMAGDISGAGFEVLSGATGAIPGIGTAASFGIDAALMARDNMDKIDPIVKDDIPKVVEESSRVLEKTLDLQREKLKSPETPMINTAINNMIQEQKSSKRASVLIRNPDSTFDRVQMNNVWGRVS
ncbi:peptidase [Synechococcus phage BUCT-ZZ01]|nr:peptidase [Synechococcus phage BUCT-ZZ01]